MSNSFLPQIPLRRFGRTNIEIPILSIGGMRFQQSWEDLSPNEIRKESQSQLEETLQKGFSLGLNHLETARHYGTSERQIGWALEKIQKPNIILQTKVPPSNDVNNFERELNISFKRLGSRKLDLLAIHGINLPEHLEQTLRPGGCLEVVRKWQDMGRISSVGFSTHAPTALIVDAIQSNEFDYVNLHWYFIKQENERALDAASKHDMGVFIISPTDKGGHLHTPSPKLVELCSPLHPIIFNDLFCLRDSRVHTISVGLSNHNDLDLHLEAVNLLGNVENYVPKIQKRLVKAADLSLGKEWMLSWEVGLPDWRETPGNINIPILLWLYNLLEAWDMESYVQARYGLLGKAGHWFPGENADCLDLNVSCDELKQVLFKSPWKDEIPEILRELKARFGGVRKKRLWSD